MLDGGNPINKTFSLRMLPLSPLRIISNTYCDRTYCTVTENSTVNFGQVHRNFWLIVQKDGALHLGASDVSVQSIVCANVGEVRVGQQTVCPVRPQLQLVWNRGAAAVASLISSDSLFLFGQTGGLCPGRSKFCTLYCRVRTVSLARDGLLTVHYGFCNYQADQVNENEVGGRCS